MRKVLVVLTLIAANCVLAAGAVWTAFGPEFELASLLPENGGDGSIGFSVSHDTDDLSVTGVGKCIAAIGDTNGDGADDFLIGSWGLSFVSARAYVIYGGDQLDKLAEFELTDLFSANGGDGSRGRVINGGDRRIGESCSGAGDINADGYSDFVLMGSPTHYVVYGGPGEIVGAELDIATLEPAASGDGSRGFQLLMPSLNTLRVTLDRAAGGGDFNNDGIDDLAVGSPEAEAVYLIYGDASGFPAAFDPESLRPANGGDGTAGMVIFTSEPGTQAFGDAVELIDDFNGDGTDDLGLTYIALGFEPRAIVIYGSGSAPAQIDVIDLFPDNGGDGSTGVIVDNVFTTYVNDVGDFNGDGFSDIVAVDDGFPVGDLSRIFITFGGPALPPYLDANDFLPQNGGDGSRGVVIQGFRPYSQDFMGEWADGVGDINGDGLDDISVAGLFTDDSYVVFGTPSPPALLSLFDLTGDGGADGTRGFLLRGYDASSFSTKSVRAGDINADGRPDLLTADWAADLFTGRADIVYGRGDGDGDGIGDFEDNCIERANTDQRDTDNDGFGNVCDPDLNNDLIVNFADLQMLRDAYFSTPADPRWNEDADLNGDGVVGFVDNQLMRSQFFALPGPSALHNDK